MASNPLLTMAPELLHHRFSLDEYEKMIECGVLDTDDRVELLAGEIVEKMGEGSRHSSCVARLTRHFVLALGNRAILLPHGPVALPPDSMPEPDITLALDREDFYAGRRPLVTDVLLLIEVADSSLREDRKIKLPIYAKAGVTEYWIVNVVDRVIEVYSKPNSSGYSESRAAHVDETIAPIAFADIALKVRDIIPE